jgi:hypothetical protein
MEPGAIKSRPVTGNKRSVRQQATLAVRDVYDAAVELITNADDRYQILDIPGRIEIEVERRRGGHGGLMRFRDFADGINDVQMDTKLGETGGRVSGLAEGKLVRGTNSRGAKDVAALGKVTFESITPDGRYHRCVITPGFEFNLFASEEASAEHREKLGIEEGSGTLVTIQLSPEVTVPQHDNLRHGLETLVSLGDILKNPQRTLTLVDLRQGRKDQLRAPTQAGTERLKDTFEVPGYPGATAKITIKRANKPFEQENPRFRRSGIVVKSSYAIHEATLFDSSLERDQHALRFFGRLACPYIDKLWNDFDDRFEDGDPEWDPQNPAPVIDPSRKAGLTRSHPFVKALFRECLKRLRPLVDEERRREESERAQIESDATRKRLNKLEKAASKFMQKYEAEEDSPQDHGSKVKDGKFLRSGYQLSPPFAQLVVGQSTPFRLNILQEKFPEFEVGAMVEIECLTSDISSSKSFAALEPHPNQEGVLQAQWNVKGLKATPASGIRATIGSIIADNALEVFATDADRFAHVEDLMTSKKTYRVRAGKRKNVRVLAPLTLVPVATELSVELTNSRFAVVGSTLIKPVERYGVALADLVIRAKESKAQDSKNEGTITIRLGDASTSAELLVAPPEGAGIKIKLEDIKHGNQRYRWRQNLLEIAARHPALQRYLGPKHEDFPGQEAKHFRTILAEIVTEAVCAKTLAQMVADRPDEFEDPDWDTYYAEYTKLTAEFGEEAHKLVVPVP